MTGSSRRQRLTALRVGNFKAFAETQRVPVRPITLIYGPNSAGKSSLVQALALAHEAEFGSTATLVDIDVHQTRVGGSAIDLGGFRQYVHRGEANRRVEWGAEVAPAAMADAGYDPQQRFEDLTDLGLNISLGIEVDEFDNPRPSSRPHIDAIQVVSGGGELLRMSRRPLENGGGHRSSRFRIDRIATDHAFFSVPLSQAADAATGTRVDQATYSEMLAALVPAILISSARLLPADAVASVDDRAKVTDDPAFDELAATLKETIEYLLSNVSRMVQAEIGSLSYLGPLRSLPPRHLALADQGDPNRVAGGAYAWDEVRRNDDVREAVNLWLGSSRLKTRYSLVARSLMPVDGMKRVIEDELANTEYEAAVLAPQEEWPEGEASERDDDADLTGTSELAERLTDAIRDSGLERFRELVLIDQLRNTVVTHRDVGVGISQVLPVLVMAYASRDAVVAMEQPEIHLHPALQAELGDVLIESALGERQNTLLIETHSEHLLLRIMRRIRETTEGRLPIGVPSIAAADVSVLYVEPVDRRSIVRVMPLTIMGELAKSWPGGFFEEGLREQFDDLRGHFPGA